MLKNGKLQPVAVINYPNDHEYTRGNGIQASYGTDACEEQHRLRVSVRWRRSLLFRSRGPENAAIYKQYETLAAQTTGVHFSGRLATYKYYNMDQVVAQSLTLCAKLVGADPARNDSQTGATRGVGPLRNRWGQAGTGVGSWRSDQKRINSFNKPGIELHPARS